MYKLAKSSFFIVNIVKSDGDINTICQTSKNLDIIFSLNLNFLANELAKVTV